MLLPGNGLIPETGAAKDVCLYPFDGGAKLFLSHHRASPPPAWPVMSWCTR
jgi:hypothetical protein